MGQPQGFSESNLEITNSEEFFSFFQRAVAGTARLNPP